MNRQPASATDRRGAVTALSHALTLGMTSLLVLALLIGTTGFLETQKSVTAESELRTIGNRISGELSHVDQLGKQGGTATIRVNHPGVVAGSTYDARLEQGAACPDVADETCLVMTATEFDITQTIPVFNETGLRLESHGGGSFVLRSLGSATATHGKVAGVDLSSRIGIGRSVKQDSYASFGSLGNRPPIAKFDFKPGTPQSNDPVRFDAGDSFDPDGSIQIYRWDFNNNGTYGYTTPDPVIYHSFSAGDHTISLEVKDDSSAVTNVSRTIDVSGLRYLGDMDVLASDDNGVKFSVQNEFADDVEIHRIMINPHSNSITPLSEGGSDHEIEVDVGSDGTVEGYIEEYDQIDLHDGGRILEFDVSGNESPDEPEIPPNEIAKFSFRYFPKPMQGEDMTFGIQYSVNGTPNSTIITDTVGGPDISNYEVTATGQDVDVEFESNVQLTTLEAELGGNTSGTLTTGDFSETGSGPYVYRADVSDGKTGTFWAKLTVAEAGGTPTGDTPLNDSAIVSGPLTWTTATDWDNRVAESGLVHASYGDHESNEVSLGYDATGPGLVGFWSLDDPTQATDASGTGNHGSVQGNPGGTNGIGISDSYHFDGSDDHVRVSNDPSIEMGSGTEQVSVSAWVNKDSSQSNWIAMLQHSDQSFNLQFENGDEPVFTIHDDGSWISADLDNTVATNQWYHFVGTFDGDDDVVRLYVDGSEVDSAYVPEMDSTNFDLGIAENLDSSGRHLDGKMDEIRLYDRELSSGEVQDLYDAATTGTMETAQKVHPSGDRDVSSLQLQHDTKKAGGETIEVKVHTAAGEESGWITVPDGVGSVAVPGLSTDTDTFWLEIKLDSSSALHSPIVNELSLQQ